MAASTVTAFVKRRFSEDDEDDREEWPIHKRFNDNAFSTAQANMLQKQQQQQEASMPSITYASPDYRPPVTLNPLWLQPTSRPPQQQVVAQEHHHHQQQQRQPRQSHSGGAMMLDETDSTDEDELTTLVQTPSSILDESIKGSLESDWSNRSLDQWHQA